MLIYFLKKGEFLSYEGKSKYEKIKLFETYKLHYQPEITMLYLPYEFIHFYNAVRMTNIIDFPMDNYEPYRKIFRSFLTKIGASDKEYPSMLVRSYI